MHHIFAITLGLLVPLIGGCCNVLCSGPRRIKYFLDNYPISGMFIVPLMAETLAAEIWREAKRQKRTAILKALLLLSNTLYRLGLDVRRVLLRSVRKNFGGRLKILVSGGGQLSADLHSLFRGLGIALFNGYGITEGGGAVSVGRQHYWRDGSVGVPLRNISVKIADGGEILIYGKNVFLGYYGDPEATAVSFTEEGWFKTGDLGYFDEDGFLFLTGRIKNLIITANGENVSPEGLEEKIIQIPGVKEVLVYQEGNEIIAEIYPDPENPDAAAQIPAAVDELNRKLPLYSQIARTKLRGSEFPKTATMKVKRN
jgi:long-chain acyl-CoA synthetase